ncbi:MAG: glycosyltransferase family 4 protein [Lachnospiraceae bacterium]|nr:glycosyltransferase family 4 protein [Lachnospiraceae bacterium]
MSRVLILANFSGGLYDFRNEFVEALLAEHEVYISLPDDVKTKELQAEGANIIQTPMSRRGMNPLEDVHLYRNYCKIMKEIRPDLVVTYTIKPNIYGGFCARRMRIPYIATITGLGSAFEKNALFVRLIVTMYRTALKKAACIFFQNAENRSIFRKYGIAGRKDRLVMGSGVNLEKHPYEPYPKREETHFLFVGRVMKEKGILEFLSAAESLHSDKVFFDILGACDEDYQEMLDQAEHKGIIRQLGFHKEVHPYLTDANAVVIPSYHEGMCNSLTEAAATGRPVIASNISGCMETFEEGKSGFGFTPGKAEELIAALQKFLALPYEEKAKMGQEARRKMEREFDRTLVTRAYVDEVNKILAKF